MSEIFKSCSCCGKIWPEREAFLNDTTKRLVGYQVDFASLDLGYILFNCECNSTLAIEAGEFRDLYSGEVFVEKKTGSEECPGYCLHKQELRPCPARCECAYVREILQILQV